MNEAFAILPLTRPLKPASQGGELAYLYRTRDAAMQAILDAGESLDEWAVIRLERED